MAGEGWQHCSTLPDFCDDTVIVAVVATVGIAFDMEVSIFLEVANYEQSKRCDSRYPCSDYPKSKFGHYQPEHWVESEEYHNDSNNLNFINRTHFESFQRSRG